VVGAGVSALGLALWVGARRWMTTGR
jgi:hypothetical protein